METKKNTCVNLDKKRTLFFETGFIVVLFLVLVAFEWKILPEENKFFSDNDVTIVYEDIIQTTQNETQKPKITPPLPQVDIMKIVDDSKKIETEYKIGDTEANDTTKITVTPMPEVEDTMVYDSWKVEKMPRFVGGDEALYKWIQDNIKYPKELKEIGIEGMVGVQFVVDKDGKVKNIEISRSLDPALDKFVSSKILEMPNWEPGFKDGKYVAVKYALPIKFKLY
ncbi:MAG TPA: energy transducer TonB [Bacteroidales bacterium]|nr:energy transducer TonB [Bacteroidales bacterium]HOU97477.1 energy transducer TonB [Bacteroidales bacterium]